MEKTLLFASAASAKSIVPFSLSRINERELKPQTGHPSGIWLLKH